MISDEVIRKIKKLANKKNVAGMERFGIRPQTKLLGVSIYELRKIAKGIEPNHELALKLWASKIHEARLLACLIDEPAKLTERQMEGWLKDFDSWDICDQVCSNLFDKHKLAHRKAKEWTKRKREFEKRAGYVMMACLAVHDLKTRDQDFLKFFTLIKEGAVDERNFVKKAVNWALRQIGKRNLYLNKQVIKLAGEIKKMDSNSAHWVANDALRELTSLAVQQRLKKKSA